MKPEGDGDVGEPRTESTVRQEQREVIRASIELPLEPVVVERNGPARVLKQLDVTGLHSRPTNLREADSNRIKISEAHRKRYEAGDLGALEAILLAPPGFTREPWVQEALDKELAAGTFVRRPPVNSENPDLGFPLKGVMLVIDLDDLKGPNAKTVEQVFNEELQRVTPALLDKTLAMANELEQLESSTFVRRRRGRPRGHTAETLSVGARLVAYVDSLVKKTGLSRTKVLAELEERGFENLSGDRIQQLYYEMRRDPSRQAVLMLDPNRCGSLHEEATERPMVPKEGPGPLATTPGSGQEVTYAIAPEEIARAYEMLRLYVERLRRTSANSDDMPRGHGGQPE